MPYLLKLNPNLYSNQYTPQIQIRNSVGINSTDGLYANDDFFSKNIQLITNQSCLIIKQQ